MVWIDGRRAFDISAEVAEEAGLRREHVLTESEVHELLRADEPFRARALALKMLARRDVLGSEVVAKLCNSGFSEARSAAVLMWLEDQGYVDDARYAATFISQRTKCGWGKRRVLGELNRMGLDPQIAREAWERWSSGRDERADSEELLALVERRFGAKMRSEPEVARKRISGFLARRGHDWEVVAEVVKAVESRSGMANGDS